MRRQEYTYVTNIIFNSDLKNEVYIDTMVYFIDDESGELNTRNISQMDVAYLASSVKDFESRQAQACLLNGVHL